MSLRIPHRKIQETFTKPSLKTVPQILFIRTGMQEAEFRHVRSFRRQVFINEEEQYKILESIYVEHENYTYPVIQYNAIFVTNKAIMKIIVK